MRMNKIQCMMTILPRDDSRECNPGRGRNRDRRITPRRPRGRTRRLGRADDASAAPSRSSRQRPGGLHRTRVGDLALRVVEEDDQRPAVGPAAVMGRVLLQLFRQRGGGQRRPGELDRNRDPLRRQQEVGAAGGRVVRRPPLRPDGVEMEGQDRPKEVFEIGFILDAEGRAVALPPAQLADGARQPAEQALQLDERDGAGGGAVAVPRQGGAADGTAGRRPARAPIGLPSPGTGTAPEASSPCRRSGSGRGSPPRSGRRRCGGQARGGRRPGR